MDTLLLGRKSQYAGGRHLVWGNGICGSQDFHAREAVGQNLPHLHESPPAQGRIVTD